jgi:pimeloyl-ACP methyl ester carboxylesterase
MNTALSRILTTLLVIATTGLAAAALAADAKVKIEDKYATVNGVKLHYLTAGRGEPVILLHGYAQNSHMWRPLMAELGKTRLVIAPDLRGFGDSAKPACCYDKKSMAQDIHALAQSLTSTRLA